MNKITFFSAGFLCGVAATLGVVIGYVQDDNEISGRPQDMTLAPTQIPDLTPARASPVTPKQTIIESNNKTVAEPELMSLLRAFKSKSGGVYEREEYKDLAYLIRQDNNLAALVRNMVLESESYEEKYALINVLSQDHSPETNNFVVDLINTSDDENKRLGYELLGLMRPNERSPELSNALIDASYNESNPEFLAKIIYRLSEAELDEMSKTVAIQQFQSFLYSESNTIKADAIGGISRLADQDTIRDTAKEFIHDSNEAVRISAIGSLFKLESSQFDQEIISSIAEIAKNPEESQNARNIAAAVLESKKPFQ